MDSRLGEFRFSRRAGRTIDQPISHLMRLALEQPGLISLAAGFVDDATLPTMEAGDLMRGLMAGPAGARALQYGTTIGLRALRRAVLGHVARMDGVTPARLAAHEDQVVITTGSQQLLYLLTDLLVDEGDIVITAWPSYFVYTSLLPTFGATVRCVEQDEEGIKVEALAALLQEIEAAGQIERVKILYLCSYFENPTGLTLSARRRPQVLDLVRRYSRRQRILLLEDAAYRELAYPGPGSRGWPASLRSLDDSGALVAYAGTFSKPFAPGLKTGYGLLPADLVEPLLLAKGSHDFGSANLGQHLLYEALASGVYQRHVAQLRRAYAAKRDAMLGALQEHLGGGQAQWTRPEGGLYVFVTLPPAPGPGIDTGPEGRLFRAALEAGVLYVPGAYCYPQDPARRAPVNTMRLSFGVPSVEEIREALRRLARALREVAG